MPQPPVQPEPDPEEQFVVMSVTTTRLASHGVARGALILIHPLPAGNSSLASNTNRLSVVRTPRGPVIGTVRNREGFMIFEPLDDPSGYFLFDAGVELLGLVRSQAVPSKRSRGADTFESN